MGIDGKAGFVDFISSICLIMHSAAAWDGRAGHGCGKDKHQEQLHLTFQLSADISLPLSESSHNANLLAANLHESCSLPPRYPATSY